MTSNKQKFKIYAQGLHTRFVLRIEMGDFVFIL